MKILSVNQIRQADQYTIEHEPIASIDLMERASQKCVDWMLENLLLEDKTVHLFCGVGNNGGDGLAIARLLKSHCRIVVSVVHFSDKTSEDFKTNLKRLLGMEVNHIKNLDEVSKRYSEDYVVDAIFGSGLNRKLDGWMKSLISSLNESMGMRISIDIPSGLFADNNSGNDFEAVFRADVSLSFQNPKLAFFMPESGNYCGEWEILDIGLHTSFIEKLESQYYTTNISSLTPHLKMRQKFGHKGEFGHALIVAGSRGKMGASLMASKACLKSGIGLLTNYTCSSGNDVVQNGVPEAMTMISKGEDFISDVPNNLEPYNVIGIGPGIGVETPTARALGKLLDKIENPMVIDADAINIIAEHHNLLNLIPKNSIFTPHPGEFRRLVGAWDNDHERLLKQINFSKKYNVILVLKGAHTAISVPDGNVYFNSSGNPGMATAGSGDVLLGVITGLLGRGYEPTLAARLGVFVHGLAGDFAAAEKTEESLVSSDIINNLSEAFKTLYYE